MLLNGNVCFFIMYQYEANVILATPILGFDLSSILEAYKKNFQYLKEKGYKSKLNITDNQAMKVINAYLTPNKSASGSSNRTTAASTPPKETSKPSRIVTLEYLAQPMPTS
jgi:hypothetical protein